MGVLLRVSSVDWTAPPTTPSYHLLILGGQRAEAFLGTLPWATNMSCGPNHRSFMHLPEVDLAEASRVGGEKGREDRAGRGRRELEGTRSEKEGKKGPV